MTLEPFTNEAGEPIYVAYYCDRPMVAGTLTDLLGEIPNEKYGETLQTYDAEHPLEPAYIGDFEIIPEARDRCSCGCNDAEVANV